MRKDGQIKEKAAWPSALSRTLSAVELKPVSGSLQSVGLKSIKAHDRDTKKQSLL